MSFPATTTATKPVATTLHGTQSAPHIAASLWSLVQTKIHAILQPSRTLPLEIEVKFPHPSPESYGLPPLSPHPDHIETASVVPEFIAGYARTLDAVWRKHDWSDVILLVETLRRCWRENRQVFLCGNGGSAANAIHLANDLLYGVDKKSGRGLRVTALPANAAVLTCLANDIAYEDIFAQQLTVLAQPGDILLAFSGSGNSPNIVKALSKARELGVTSFAILGFTGGRALTLADHPIYFPAHDMQVSEDLQMMVGHMAMQYLTKHGR
jgi:D-sedoheptulose 7-phosphate isomerase